MTQLAAEPRPRAGGSPSANSELSHSDNYLSGAKFTPRSPLGRACGDPRWSILMFSGC